MNCPSCGHKNIGGSDECDSCHQDLSSLDGVVPKSKIEKILMQDPISRLKSVAPVIVQRNVSVLEAIRKMKEGKFGCLLIFNDNRMEGILTERDILFKAQGKFKDLFQDLSKIPVSEIMTANPEALSEEDSLAYAVNKMSLGGFRHIPILRDGRPTGIISARDVLRYLSKLFPE